MSTQYVFPKQLLKPLRISAKLFFVAGLIFLITVVSLSIDADPHMTSVSLKTNESYTSPINVANFGDTIQLGFAVRQVNGQDLNLENEFASSTAFENQKEKALIRMIVEVSDNKDFENSLVQATLDGIALAYDFELTGYFYRYTLQNISQESVFVSSGNAEANIGLIFLTIITGILVGITIWMLQFSFLILFWGFVITLIIYLIKDGTPRAEEYFGKRYIAKLESQKNDESA